MYSLSQAHFKLFGESPIYLKKNLSYPCMASGDLPGLYQWPLGRHMETLSWQLLFPLKKEKS